MKKANLLSVLAITTFVGACSAAEQRDQSTWIAQIGGLGPEIAFDVTETSDGRLCATGTFFNTAEFGAGERRVSLVADHIQDIYLACYTRDGELATAVQFGTRQGEEPRAIAALPGGDVVITGYFTSAFGVGKSAATQAAGGPDIFLSRIDADGKEVWTKRFGGKSADIGSALAVNSDGDILLAGNFRDVMTFEAGGKTRKLVSAGDRDAFVLKLTADGEALWGRSFGGPGRDEALRVTNDAGGRVLVAGVFHKEARLADSSAPSMIALGNSDAFLFAFESNGDLAWSKQIAGKNREHVSGLASDSEGHVYLAGSFLQTIVTPAGNSLVSAGSTDIFLVKFDRDGGQLWAHRLGGEQVDEAFDLDITPEDSVLISGHFQGRSDFAPGEQVFEMTSTGEGNSDAFLLEIDGAGQIRAALIGTGQGVEMAFAVAALAEGGLVTAGLFNQDLDLHLAGFEAIKKRGKTDVFLARLDRAHLASMTAARHGNRKIRTQL